MLQKATSPEKKEEIHRLVAKDSVLSKRCFIVKKANGDLKCLLSNLYGYCDDIESTQVMENGEVAVVTVTESCKLHNFIFPVICEGGTLNAKGKSAQVIYTAPLPAHIVIRVSDIPHLLMKTFKSEFLQEVEKLSNLSKVLSNLKVDLLQDVEYGGKHHNMVVEGNTHDFQTFINLLQNKPTITFRGFTGRLHYHSGKPMDIRSKSS